MYHSPEVSFLARLIKHIPRNQQIKPSIHWGLLSRLECVPGFLPLPWQRSVERWMGRMVLQKAFGGVCAGEGPGMASGVEVQGREQNSR